MAARSTTKQPVKAIVKPWQLVPDNLLKRYSVVLAVYAIGISIFVAFAVGHENSVSSMYIEPGLTPYDKNFLVLLLVFYAARIGLLYAPALFGRDQRFVRTWKSGLIASCIGDLIFIKLAFSMFGETVAYCQTGEFGTCWAAAGIVIVAAAIAVLQIIGMLIGFFYDKPAPKAQRSARG